VPPTPPDSKTALDHIEQHARHTPDRIAITGPITQRSWAQFHADAKRVTKALAKLEIQPGQIVAISHPDRYIHWLLLIACESLGAVSGSFTAEDPAEDVAPLLSLANLVLTKDRIGELIAQDDKAEGHRRHPALPDAPLRIVRTSGSTGTPKYMTINRRMQSYWLASLASYNSLGSATRFYVAYPPSVNPSYYRMETCLRLGATLIFGAVSQDLITYEATHCWLLPRDMVILLQGVRGAWPSLQPLRMILGGGPVSATLHDQTAALLGTPVQIVYAANETGFIALQDRDGIGTILPDVDLQIVDENGRPVPEGSPGIIAIRTPGLVEGYLNDPEANRAFFRDGRFFTDDAGLLLPDGRLRVLGRRSEILNLGGLKLSLAPIEALLRDKVGGLRDVAVTSLPNLQGIEEICIAIVSDGSANPAALLESVRQTLPPTLGKFWLMSFDRLPLGTSGKVQRSALKDIFRASQTAEKIH
jgi:acyl-CoA synthetase (AMP-forming)/AMP-acid ligase II